MSEITEPVAATTLAGVDSSEFLERPGYEALWLWFSLSYASWLTLPRVLMHEMPDDWQKRMAELLAEWDDTWDSSELPSPSVTAKAEGKFTKWPEWVLSYRHPDKAQIDRLRSNRRH